ncbi:MAG: HIT family protein [Deltaproteobacteria bacterium]|nr:HIT family protein [Deltaproteobacteria bacterium]
MNTTPPCPMCSRWETDNDLRIVELPHSYVVLNRDQFFPGYTLLFTRQHVTELFHLDRRTRSELMEEVSLVAHALYAVFRPTKINYELLGNMVPHMHWHLVPRFAHEPLWPRPIWAEPHPDTHLAPNVCMRRIEQIRKALS